MEKTDHSHEKAAGKKITARHNTFNDYQIYALLFILSTPSKLVYDINQQLASAQTTADDVVTYFSNRLKGAPFNFSAGDFDINYFKPLMVFNNQKRATFNNNPSAVAAALELPYDTPPCPPDPPQTAIWTRLVNLKP